MSLPEDYIFKLHKFEINKQKNESKFQKFEIIDNDTVDIGSQKAKWEFIGVYSDELEWEWSWTLFQNNYHTVSVQLPEELQNMRNGKFKLSDPELVSILLAYVMDIQKYDYIYISKKDTKFSAFGVHLN